MASKSSKSTPEYEVLHKYLHKVCDALSKLPDSITPLARDLCSSDIISSTTMSSASNTAEAPYYRANVIMTAAHVSVQQDPRKFDAVLEKLSDHGLNGLAKEMNDRLGNHKPLRKRNLKIKQQMNILVVGHNGNGKSSLINEMLGGIDVAIIGRPDYPTPHDPIEEYNCKVGGVNVTIFDTRGLGDPLIKNQKTMEEIAKIKTVDVVLLCHKLYARVDDASVKELKVLVDNMGKDLIDLTVLVFTFGDDYLSRCEPDFTSIGRLTEDSKEKIRNEMVTQQGKMDRRLKEVFRKIGVDKAIADRIPSCITCGKRKKNGEQKELPTSDNWIKELWGFCEDRCKPEARPFVHSMGSTIIDTLMMGRLGGGAVGARVTTRVEAGATIGTALTPCSYPMWLLRMGSFSKSTPEYEVLREYLHRICGALSKLPDSITPLARDFCASDIITSAIMSSASNTTQAPYFRANAIMTAAHVSVEQEPKKFGAVVEKLSDHGLRGLAKEMNDRLDNYVVRAQDVRSTTPHVPSEKYNKRDLKIKRQIKILVVGHNGSGKSSLINEMLGGMEVATVGRPEDPTPHKPIEEHNHTVGDVDVTIFDTRGLGDPSIIDKKTMESITKIKTVDVVLICHKLYGRIDDATKKELEVLVDKMGNDLLDLSVLVFTFGDQYLSRCEPDFVSDGRLTEESKEEVKNELVTQQAKMERRFKEAFISIGINKTIANRIPSCVTCGKRKRNGEQKELPTSDNWVDDLWDLCEQRCKLEARPFVRSMKRTIIDTLVMGGLGGGAVGAILGGVITGIEAGATLGTVATPGIGSAVGAVAGGVVGGAIAGGIYGVGLAGIGATAVGIGARVVKVVQSKSDESD